MKKVKALVIDWGVGGFSVVRRLAKKKLPVDVVYVSDSGFTPYGKLSKPEVRERIGKIIKTISKEHKIDLVIIACNAASTAFIGKESILKRPLINMIEPTATALAKLKKSSITVVGGDLTVQSKSYSRLLKDSKHQVEEVSLQPLSALIEKGITGGAKIEKLLRDRLGELKSSQVVLACTHYPAAQKTFEKLYSMSEVVDPALAVAKVLKKKILKKKLSKKEKYKLMVVFTTGSVKSMPTVLKKAFGLKVRKKLFKSLSV